MHGLKTTVLLAVLTGLLLLIGSFIGGKVGMTFMFVVSMAMNLVSYWFSDKIVLSMYGAREVTPQEVPDLIRMVSGLTQKARLPMPKVYIVESEVPNAFATGRDPEHSAVAVTTGTMRALGSEELEGVIAHELAHIKNRDTLISTIVATIAGVITMLAHIVQMEAIFGHRDEERNGGILEFIFLVVLAPLAATLIQLGISRTREYKADACGSAIAGNPLALANALVKLENYAEQRLLPEATPATSHLFIINPFIGSRDWLMSLFSTHPATAQRVERLEELARKMR